MRVRSKFLAMKEKGSTVWSENAAEFWSSMRQVHNDRTSMRAYRMPEKFISAISL